jgi:hypothetical protein
MNNSRLTTNSACPLSPPTNEMYKGGEKKGACEESSSALDIKERALKLLSTPSNYEVQPDGKILIKSLGTY